MSAGTALRRRKTGRATYRDVLDAPPHMVAEIVDGALHLQPRPAMPHALAGSSLGDELVSPFQKGRGGPGGWWIIDEPELHFGEDVLVPDLAGWRRERMPDYPDTPYGLSTSNRSAPSMRGKGSAISGSSIRRRGRWRRLRSWKAAGRRRVRQGTTIRCPFRPSRPSLSP